VGGDPGFGGRVGVRVEAPGGTPQILQDMDEVDQDVDVGVAAGGFGLDLFELVAGAVEGARSRCAGGWGRAGGRGRRRW
jgi:hypothetical protein